MLSECLPKTPFTLLSWLFSVSLLCKEISSMWGLWGTGCEKSFWASTTQGHVQTHSEVDSRLLSNCKIIHHCWCLLIKIFISSSGPHKTLICKTNDIKSNLLVNHIILSSSLYLYSIFPIFDLAAVAANETPLTKTITQNEDIRQQFVKKYKSIFDKFFYWKGIKQVKQKDSKSDWQMDLWLSYMSHWKIGAIIELKVESHHQIILDRFIQLKGACSDPQLHLSNFFQTYDDFGTKSWAIFRRLYVWNFMRKVSVF